MPPHRAKQHTLLLSDAELQLVLEALDHLEGDFLSTATLLEKTDEDSDALAVIRTRAEQYGELRETIEAGT